MTSSAIPPAPPPLPQTAAAAAQPVLTVAVASEAQALARLPAGALVLASLDAVDAKGLVSVTTAEGTSLELRLPPGLTLPADAELGLQVITQGGSPALRLLSVNGRPWGTPPPPGLAQPDPGAILDGKGPSPLKATLTPATMLAPAMPSAPLGLTATVVRGLPAQAQSPAPPGLPGFTPGQPLAPPPGLENLTPGTQMTVRIHMVAPPGGGMAAPLLPPNGETTAAPSVSQSQPTPAATPATPGVTIAAQPPQGQTGFDQGHSGSQGKGQGQGQGQTPLPTPAQPVPGQTTPPATAVTPPPVVSLGGASAPNIQLPGTVTAHAAGGGALVHTPAGLLSLPAGPALAQGAAVLLDVVGPPLPPAAAPPARPSEGLSAAGWPTLQESATALAQADAQAAGQLLRMIPQATPRLAAALSLFAGAVRSGDFKALGLDGIGRGLERAGRRDLAQRMGRDLKELADEAERPRGDGTWQMITMPFAHGAQVDPIRLFVPRVKGDDEERTKGGHEQRFILEVAMSRLGRIQFDGLVQKDARRFDLIIRTEAPLDSDIRNGILGIFAESGQLTGIKGGVTFLSGRGFVELPPADTQGTRIMV